MGVAGWTGDVVTFAITLPAGGLFDDQIEALQIAKLKAVQQNDIAAAQALHTILVLAERGLLAFNTDTNVPAFLKTG